jgi:hypothetical protein
LKAELPRINAGAPTKPDGKSSESIARRAEQGRDVSHFFTNRGRIMPPIQRVNVDFTAPMLKELHKPAQSRIRY